MSLGLYLKNIFLFYVRLYHLSLCFLFYLFFKHFLMYLFSLKTGKNRRLKQAKEEAQAEIEQYRLQREKEFKAKEAAVRPLIFIAALVPECSLSFPSF